ncbi:MAG: hypothetical protein KBE09_01830 [Candidatus Pacebacteria bacterium]|nr:hypothetical protein [Candidatus Paceibacterota bacterium]
MKWFVGKWLAHAMGGAVASFIVELFKGWKQGARYPLYRAWRYTREHRWVQILMGAFVALALFEAAGGSLERLAGSVTNVAFALAYGGAAMALYFWPLTLGALITATVLWWRRA